MGSITRRSQADWGCQGACGHRPLLLWEQRLQAIDTDLEREPDRIRRTFQLRTQRVEPAGAIYPWPQEPEPQGAPL